MEYLDGERTFKTAVKGMNFLRTTTTKSQSRETLEDTSRGGR